MSINQPYDQPDNDDELVVESSTPQVAQPKMYKVILINDDYTPMDFVVEVLKKFFGMQSLQATNIMMQIHSQGQAVCGVFTRDIAESKVQLVNDYSRLSQQPLICTLDVA